MVIPILKQYAVATMGLLLFALVGCGEPTPSSTTTTAPQTTAPQVATNTVPPSATSTSGLVTVAPTATATAAPTTSAPTPTIPATVAPTTAPPPTGDAKAGLAKFKAAGCVGCHPNDGKEAGYGPSLVGAYDRRGAAYIITNIRQGRGGMLPYSPERVTDTDIQNLLAYLQTLK